MDRQALKKAYAANELSNFRESLPMDERAFLPLFDYLDIELPEHGCKHDLSLIEKYCADQELDFARLKKWLADNGGFCDCEVLANVEEKFDYLKEATPRGAQKKAQPARRKLNSLKTDSGFSVGRVPPPWTLFEIEQAGGTVHQFQLGKKTECVIALTDDSSLVGMMDEDSMREYWRQHNDLPDRAGFIFENTTLCDFTVATVLARQWAPVIAFIRRPGAAWCLVMRTTTVRLRNDLKELALLLKEIDG